MRMCNGCRRISVWTSLNNKYWSTDGQNDGAGFIGPALPTGRQGGRQGGSKKHEGRKLEIVLYLKTFSEEQWNNSKMCQWLHQKRLESPFSTKLL